jgi:hypothetical protein
MSLFSRRSFVWRYAIVVGLTVYLFLFAGFIQHVPVSINTSADSPYPEGIDGGPTPASVAAALRAPLEFRPSAAENVPVADLARELTSTTPKHLLGTTSPTKKPSEEERVMDLLKRNASVLHKANMTDFLKVAKVAAETDGSSGYNNQQKQVRSETM